MAENTLLVSVIIPAYNCEAYIGQCIQSVLNQSYPNLQIIVVDDGSRDRTYEICAGIADERIALFKKENGGASSARNDGLNHAQGDYILFADSDDFLDRDAVRTLVEQIQRESADLIYFEADNFTEDSGIKIKEKGFSQKQKYSVCSGNELIPQLVKNKDYHAAPFLFFIKKEVFENGLRFHEGIMMEDELFSFRLFRMSRRVSCLPAELYHRRVRPGSVMTSSGKEVFRYVSIRTVLQELLKERQDGSDDPTLELYLARIGMLTVGYWEQVPKEKRSALEEWDKNLYRMIRREKGFGCKELIVRTYGRTAWLLYILPGRVSKKIGNKMRGKTK